MCAIARSSSDTYFNRMRNKKKKNCIHLERKNKKPPAVPLSCEDEEKNETFK